MNIKKMGEQLVDIGGLYSHFHTVISTIGSLFGKKSSPSPDLPPEKQLKGGLFSLDDEKAFVRHMTDLTKNQRALIYGLLEYHFFSAPNGERSPIRSAVAYRQFNIWRTIVTELDSPRQKLGSTEVIETIKRKVESAFQPPPQQGNRNQRANWDTIDTTTTDKTDIVSDKTKYTQKFLKQIVQIVEAEINCQDVDDELRQLISEHGTDSEQVENERLRRGYDEAVAYMRALGLPMMPEDTIVALEDFANLNDEVGGWTTKAKEWFDQQAEEIERQDSAAPRWERWMRKLIS